ncbi:MAG: phBC6A51 family helix-turn-helix protein [SAR324 cluster bacterium]|nr:phBC6A51 family helix-turn-helix protein [SAR324 cluster bacterium]
MLSKKNHGSLKRTTAANTWATGTGKWVEEIAEQIGVHRSTIWRWRQDPEFIAQWNQILTDTREEQTRSLLELQQEAIEALRGCLRSENDVVRLRASLSVLEKVASLKVGSTDAEEVQRDRIQAVKIRRMCDI